VGRESVPCHGGDKFQRRIQLQRDHLSPADIVAQHFPGVVCDSNALTPQESRH
jgi:hypothetical protein